MAVLSRRSRRGHSLRSWPATVPGPVGDDSVVRPAQPAAGHEGGPQAVHGPVPLAIGVDGRPSDRLLDQIVDGPCAEPAGQRPIVLSDQVHRPGVDASQRQSGLERGDGAQLEVADTG